MDQYSDEENLILSEKIKITKEVKQLLRKAKQRYRSEKRKVSMSKIVCNLIIKEFNK